MRWGTKKLRKEAMLYYKETLNRKATLEKFDMPSDVFRRLKNTWYEEHGMEKPLSLNDQLSELLFELKLTKEPDKINYLEEKRKELRQKIAKEKTKEIKRGMGL